jgi:hypothetical protein
MKTKTRMVLVLVAAAIAVSALATGCTASTASNSTQTTATTSAAEPTGYHIKVLQTGKPPAYVTLGQLKTLPTVTFNAYQRTETGPTLLSALKLAGIDNFARLTASGMLRGRVATGEITLSRAEVTDQVILDFSNEGKAKLAGSQIPFDNWIIDVSEVRVE